MKSRIAAALIITAAVLLAVRTAADDGGSGTAPSVRTESASGTGEAKKTAETGTAAVVTTSENETSMVPNYDFEKGKDGQPDSWGGSSGIDDFPLDNLTQFWVKRPDGVGMCIKLDTDVYMKEWKKRYDELKADPKAASWPKTQPVGKKYDTIGGNDGVRLVSKPFYFQKGKKYRITAEVRSETGTIVIIFVKGYAKVEGRERAPYDAPKHCEPEKADLGKWKTYTLTFNPGESKSIPKPEYLKVHIYAYWPAGTVYVDNILVTEEKEIKSPDAEKTGEKETPSGGENKPPEEPDKKGKKSGKF